MYKILVVIPNYGKDQLLLLEKVIREYRSFSGDYHIDIVIHSNVQLDFSNINVFLFKDMSDYYYLPFITRQTIFKHRYDYDLYIYSENDNLITQENIDAYRNVSDILPFPYVAGFMRYEIYRGKTHFPDYHASYHWLPESVVRFNKYVFAHFTNLHHASYLLTNTQLSYVIENHPDFVNILANDSKYGIKERAGTDIYTHSGLIKMIPISHFNKFTNRHLSDKYAETKFGKGDEDLNNDLNYLREYKIKMRCNDLINNKQVYHFKTILNYAKRSNHVTEIGMNWPYFTWLLLSTYPKHIVSYDLVANTERDNLIESAKIASIDFKLGIKNKGRFYNIDKTDLLLINAVNRYHRIYDELNSYSKMINKYILIYNTISHKVRINPIYQFLKINTNWKMVKHLKRNNGLMVLENTT
jgi:hypothetical protein